MNKTLLNPLKDYGYPETVLKVISKFVDIVLDVFKEDDVGVLLVGSTSRGELCWENLDQRLILFSDIEFMIAVSSESRSQKKELIQRINELSDSYDLGERFHLDYVVNRWSKLKHLQKKIFIFDCKTTGLELTEHQVKNYLPDVEKRNLDFKELNDVLLHRMKALLIDIPEDLLDGSATHTNFVLSIAKNTLDITTWLYPYEADKLLSGFECRLNKWDEKKASMLLADYFDVNDFSFVRECLNIRRIPLGSYNAILLLNNYVTIYEKAIEYCKAMNSIDCDSTIDSNTTSAELFDEFKIKRRMAEMYHILRHYKLFSASNIISNAFFPRKGRQVKFCLTMIKAIAENAGCPQKNYAAGGNEYMNKARIELNALRKVQEKYTGNFSDDWKTLRSEYLMLNKIFI